MTSEKVSEITAVKTYTSEDVYELQQPQKQFTVGDVVNYIVAEARKNLARPVKLGVKRLENYPADWDLPTFATEGSACFDLRAVIDNPVPELGNMYSNVCLTDRHTFHTGLAFDIPCGYVMKLFSRSGMGFKENITLINNTGIIDSDFKQEIMIGLKKQTYAGYGHTTIKHGDRVAQAMLIKLPEVELVEVSELVETTRFGGFGSTGV